jgi:hypothetical protein
VALNCGGGGRSSRSVILWLWRRVTSRSRHTLASKLQKFRRAMAGVTLDDLDAFAEWVETERARLRDAVPTRPETRREAKDSERQPMVPEQTEDGQAHENDDSDGQQQQRPIHDVPPVTVS